MYGCYTQDKDIKYAKFDVKMSKEINGLQNDNLLYKSHIWLFGTPKQKTDFFPFK